MASDQRKNLKLDTEAHARAADVKHDDETWSELIHRAVDQIESGSHRETSAEQIRESVREVLREKATRDLLSRGIDSVIEDRIADDIDSAIRRNPPKEAIEESVADILHSEGFTSTPLPVDRESHDDLVGVVKTAPSREWIDNFLDMAAELIDITGVTKDDEQLVTSIRTDQRSLPISLGNRYCLKGYPEEQQLMIILPHGSAAVDGLRERALSTGQFSGEEEPPHWYKLPATSADEVIIDRYYQDWKEAVEDERERGYRRVREDAHEPAVYQAATNSAYRHRLLRDAGFSK